MAKLVWLCTRGRVSRMASRKRLLYLLGLALIVAVLPVYGEVAQGAGVVVESVGAGSSLEKAGIRAGDVLLSWKRLANPPANPEAAEGVVTSYFDWLEFVMEQVLRGTVVLGGQRDGEPKEFTVEPGHWEVEVRPGLPQAFEESYSKGRTLFDSGDVEAAVRTWRSLADGARDEGDGDLQVWIVLWIGEAWVEQGAWDKAIESFRDALESSESPLVQIAVWESLGDTHESRNDFDAAEDAYDSALRIRQKLYPESLSVAVSLNHLGTVAWARRELDRARDYLLRALQIQEQLAPLSLGVATSLNNLGILARQRGELDRAHDYFLQALQIREQLAPQSLDVANSLNHLGTVAWDRGELDRVHDYLLQALRIQERLAPKSLNVVQSLVNLGAVAAARAELEGADEYLIQALQIQEQLAPHSLNVATILNNLGLVASDRGQVDRAHYYYSRALRIEEQLAPQSLEVASSLSNLGSVARIRGELDRAHEYILRALRIEEQVAPQGLDVTVSLNNLGEVARARGELDHAYEYYLRALRIQEQLAPRSREAASILNNMGTVLQDRGELDRAQKYHLRALKIREQLAPGSLDVATSLNNLGAVDWARGELDRAHDYVTRALQIRQQIAPETLMVATCLNNLGDVARSRRELEKAAEHYSRALEVLEHQVSKLGGSYNVQAGFRAQHGDFYHATLDLLLKQNRFVEAFHVLERLRAQTFLAMLAERDTIFTADIPEELDRERRRLAVRYDRTLKRLAGLNLQDHSQEIKATRQEIEKLHAEAGDLEARIRWVSPRLAALKYPRALDTAGAQQALDPGTLLLSYSVGEEDTRLFALSHTGDIQVKILPLGQETLRSQVKRLRSFVREAWPVSLNESRLERFRSASRELYDTLLEPVTEQIVASKRLLILPDGPLHALPFAALIRGGADDEAGGQYLVEWRPLHVALSATVYAELKGRRYDHKANTSQNPMQFVAFGDPGYPQNLAATEGEVVAAAPEGEVVAPTAGDSVTASRGDAVVRSAAERGIFDWPPLPYTRHEVEGIASLFPKDTARTFLGSEALEERIKNLDPRTRILHLAAHVHTDEHLPMSSFVALSIPEDLGPDRENGLLQVWEIFERVRIDADLVVLSACESGLGKELGGEGLIGLTRAFQYAGARSVAASLWSVPDQTTAELMIRFYRHLRSGLPKDEALRAAQLDFIRGPIEVTDLDGQKVRKDASAPYYWAAFQIFGDWQ